MLKRIITGVVALPVVIFLIHQGGYLFDAAVFALATVGLFELRNMARANGHDIYWLSTGITAIPRDKHLILHSASGVFIAGLHFGAA